MQEVMPELESDQRTASADEYTEEQIPMTTAPAAPPPPSDLPQSAVDQRIIYTASIRARVNDLDSATQQFVRLVNQSGGYVSSQHRTNSPYEYTAELVVRLPAERLQPTLDRLPALTESIDFQNLDSRNVTEEWLDLESRLKTKREVRDRYIDILRNRAQKVEDILEAEDKIRVITEEIEAREGRLRYLRDQVSLSTLTVTLYETQEYRETGDAYTRSFFGRIGSAFAFGWSLIQEIVLGVISLWPVLLVIGLVIYFYRRRRV
jgi:hypothetical protein